ncbi:MAG: hypothetical protein ABL901_09980 [Hyphomicrobiaceae bacterium]
MNGEVGLSYNRPLTEAEFKRLQRFERGRKNRRGRRNPASVPARLCRTAAFAPKRRGLITDSTFSRLYVVPGHSVVEVSGRELGSQHRDAIYAVFRLKAECSYVDNGNASTWLRYHEQYRTITSWRELLRAMGKKEHVNNAMTLQEVFKEIKKVAITVYRDATPDLVEKLKAGQRPTNEGAIGSIIDEIAWDGVNLDSKVRIVYGGHAVAAIKNAMLVSLNADVQFQLKSDHAKSFWPYIDSNRGHQWVDESVLASLAGRDLWGEDETSGSRAQFRKDCRQALNDMVTAGGLASWRVEIIGTGRTKSHRYHYVHKLPTQGQVLDEQQPVVIQPQGQLMLGFDGGHVV